MIKNFILYPMYKPRVGISRGPIYRGCRWLKGKKLLSHSQMDARSGSRLVDPLCLLGEIGNTRMQYGEGDGTQLQYSCLENPMDRGACWAAVYGVAQSQTRLTQLSSSSSSSGMQYGTTVGWQASQC